MYWLVPAASGDLPTWQRAAAAAAAAGMTIAKFAAAALTQKMASGDTLISVQVKDPRPRTVRFHGHWLVEPESARDAARDALDPVGPGSWTVGIAETARGRFALVLYHYELTDELSVFDSLEQLSVATETDERVESEDVERAREEMRRRQEDAANYLDI
ncbi:hypothetical protein CU254_41995 (plasmid) [Amycolatopsis sp. AA4]|nr:hypothetical protein CU254_41995 [Amycolatopsis sp. AA4]